MNKKLYVGNLAYSINEENLQEIFGEYGTVEEVKLIVDRDTNRSKGFAFVTMSTEEEAEKAINDLKDAELENRAVKISYAKPQNNRGGFNNRRNNQYNNRY
jgi:RNA recognition motif-containing protein